MENKHISLSLYLLAFFALAFAIFNLGIISNSHNLLTGAASSNVGSANITVASTVDIELVAWSVNFTETLPGQNRISTNGEVDLDPNCTSGSSECGFKLSNNGTQLINITIYAGTNIFASASYAAASHFTFNASHFNDTLYWQEPDNCSVGYMNNSDGYTTTVAFAPINTGSGNAVVALCQLNFTHDEGANYGYVNVNITVPQGESAGFKGTLITFTGQTT